MKKLITMLILVMSVFTSYTQWIIPDSTMINATTICASGNDLFAGGSRVISKSSDDGSTWIHTQVPTNWQYSFYHSAVAGSRIFMASNADELYMTSNNGNNWSAVNSPGSINHMVGLGSDIYIATNTGISKSVDGGASWFIVSTRTLIKDLKVNGSTLYYSTSGSNSHVYRSSDGGQNWIENSQLIYLQNLAFLGNNVMHASGGAQYIGLWKSADNGDTWVKYDSMYAIQCILGIAPNNILMTKDRELLVSQNSGSSWTSYNFIYPHLEKIIIKGIYVFINSESYIYRNTLSQVIAVEQISTVVPKDYQLKQNYPNPFNPSTTIRFDVAKVQLIRLTVFDVLGKKVAVLINEQLRPGTYAMDWNASGVATGVYYYKLTAGDFTETKKMMLIK